MDVALSDLVMLGLVCLKQLIRHWLERYASVVCLLEYLKALGCGLWPAFGSSEIFLLG